MSEKLKIGDVVFLDRDLVGVVTAKHKNGEIDITVRGKYKGQYDKNAYRCGDNIYVRGDLSGFAPVLPDAAKMRIKEAMNEN